MSLGDIRKKGYKEQGEGLNPGEIFQGASGRLKTGDKLMAK